MRRFVCILVVAAGCGGPSSYNEFRDQLSKGWCDRQIRCGQVAVSDAQHCEPPNQYLLGMSYVDVATSITAHHMTFHPDNARACLDAVKSGPCDDLQATIDLDRACHGIVTGAVESGSACIGDEECLGGLCVGAGCGRGVCTPFAAHGAPCVVGSSNPAETCDPSVMFCNVGRGVCEHKLQKGKPCTEDGQCLFAGACVDGKCADPARTQRGDVCGSTLPPCADGLYCDETGACAPLLDAGQPCARANACKPGLTCIGGACAPWLDAGAMCSSSPGNLAGGCAATQTCTGGACTPKGNLKLGPLARCTVDDDCAGGLYCAAGGYCYFRGGFGAFCQSAHECLPGTGCATTCAVPVAPDCAPPS